MSMSKSFKIGDKVRYTHINLPPHNDGMKRLETLKMEVYEVGTRTIHVRDELGSRWAILPEALHLDFSKSITMTIRRKSLKTSSKTDIMEG